MSDLVCERTGGLFCKHRTIFSFVGVIFLMIFSTLKNFKQLSLLSYMANFTVILAILSISFDGFTIICFR